MRVGCPKEIKADERRVALTPDGVAELVAHGHAVVMEKGAGCGAGLSDQAYRAAGAAIVETAQELFEQSEMIVKVKEPLAEERARLRPDHVLFTYLHLAADEPQTRDLLKSGATAIAYETVTSSGGGLPLLQPMSLIAGRLAAQAGAAALESAHDGRGVLLGGAPGVAPGQVTIIGAGVVGYNAAQMALGLGAEVTVLDKKPSALERVERELGGRLKTVAANGRSVAEWAAKADLVIGAALTPGARAPLILKREALSTMRPGAVLLDVAIDQGGCFETSRATTHSEPTYVLDGIVHYAVANMPGAVARTSTFALANATLPAVLTIADQGWSGAMRADPHLANGLNVQGGRLFSQPVAKAFALEAHDLGEALQG